MALALQELTVMSDHKEWPGIIGDVFGGVSEADQANARARERIAGHIASTIEEIDRSLDDIRTIDAGHRVNVEGVRNRINNLLDRLADLQRDLHEQRSSDPRPLAIKGAHGIYR